MWLTSPSQGGKSITFIRCVHISSSEVTSWCVSTYFSHLARAFSLGEDTSMALGMTGCIIVPRSRLKGGLWSTHFSWPEERRRGCGTCTGSWTFNRRQNSTPSNKHAWHRFKSSWFTHLPASFGGDRTTSRWLGLISLWGPTASSPLGLLGLRAWLWICPLGCITGLGTLSAVPSLWLTSKHNLCGQTAVGAGRALRLRHTRWQRKSFGSVALQYDGLHLV